MKKFLYGLIAIVTIALLVFLINADGGASGWQILMNQTGNEWFWMIFGSLGIAASTYVFIRVYQKEQNVSQTRLLAFAAGLILFAGIAFGKIATDKANGGVTSGNGRPGGAAQVDSTRVPAEDLK